MCIISIHAPAKGATESVNSFLFLLDFNPRSREGSDLCRELAHKFPRISIHAPAKGATGFANVGAGFSLYFNPRSREGSDLSITISGAEGCRFQSTLPRRERRATRVRLDGALPISIHAPAKGATRFRISGIFLLVFQSTLPRRERPERLRIRNRNRSISIHAPAKGATRMETCP